MLYKKHICSIIATMLSSAVSWIFIRLPPTQSESESLVIPPTRLQFWKQNHNAVSTSPTFYRRRSNKVIISRSGSLPQRFSERSWRIHACIDFHFTSFDASKISAADNTRTRLYLFQSGAGVCCKLAFLYFVALSFAFHSCEFSRPISE